MNDTPSTVTTRARSVRSFMNRVVSMKARRSLAAATAFALLVGASVVEASSAQAVPAGTPVVAVSVPFGTDPTTVASNATTNRVYVTRYGTSTVRVLNGATNAFIADISVGTYASGVAVNETTNTIYVTNYYSNSVSVIDGTTNTVTNTIRNIYAPDQIAVNATTNTVYVIGGKPGLMSVINAATNTVTNTVTLRDYSVAVAVNATTNTVYVTNMVYSLVAVIDGVTNTVTDEVQVGTRPLAVAVNATTNTVYVANTTSNSVSVIDGTTNTVISTPSVGTGPRGVAVNATTNSVYVTNFDSNSVSTIDGATNTVTSTVTVLAGPRDVAVNATTNTVYVTNQSRGTVSIMKPLPVPGAPTGVSAALSVAGATNADVQVFLDFTAPSDNVGVYIYAYAYTITATDTTNPSRGGQVYTRYSTSAILGGLTYGDNYTFTVTATNPVGTGVASAASNAVKPVKAPGAPTGVSVTLTDAKYTTPYNQVVLAFTPPSDNGGSAIASYTITATDTTNASRGGQVYTEYSSPAILGGLTNGDNYTFTVTASNRVGTGVASAASGAVTPVTVPGVPTGVSATRGNRQATLVFKAPSDNGGSVIIGYTITATDSTNAGPNGQVYLRTSSPAVLTGLRNGGKYTFTVTATNALGAGVVSATSNSVTPVAPTTLPITGPGLPTTNPVVPAPGLSIPSAGVAESGGSAAVLSWAMPSPSTGITGYTVTASPGPATCTTTSVSATSCVIGRKANTAYTYTVVAHSATGDSVAASISTTAASATSPVVPRTAPLSAPTTLTTPNGAITKAAPGQRITVTGKGFLANSTITVVAYSTPEVLASVTTDAEGNFSHPVTVPTNLAAGSHNLVALGVDPSGEPAQMRMPFTVAAAAVHTGIDPLPFVMLALLLLLVAAGIIVVIRRRLQKA